MPCYEYRCEDGHDFERYLKVAQYQDVQHCDCGKVGVRRISVPILFIKPDIYYDSPIDGRPITSMAARMEDLARSNCVPYDPDIKQHNEERVRRENAELEKAIDETVDREISLMPAVKREKLEAELQGGMTIDPIRVTPAAKPITTEISNV